MEHSRLAKMPLGSSLASLKQRARGRNKARLAGAENKSLNRRKSLSASDLPSLGVGASVGILAAKSVVPENELARQVRSDHSSHSSLLSSQAGRTSHSVAGSIGDLMNSGEFRTSPGGNWSPRAYSPITLSMVNVNERKSTESLRPRSASPRQHRRLQAGGVSGGHAHSQETLAPSPEICVYATNVDEADGGGPSLHKDGARGSSDEAARSEVNGRDTRTPRNTPSHGNFRKMNGRLGRPLDADGDFPQGSARPVPQRYMEHQVTIAVEPPCPCSEWEGTDALRDGLSAYLVPQRQCAPECPGERASARAEVIPLGLAPHWEGREDAANQEPVLRNAVVDVCRDSKKMSMAERTQMLAHLIHDQHQRSSKEFVNLVK